MIINIEPGTFGTVRGGDLIGVANIVEHLRKINNNPKIRFHMKPGSISNEKYVEEFHTFLIGITDYFSAFEGSESLPWRKVNVWDFRDICGDLVKIPNFLPMKKKIVIFPLTDAPYNQWRNWPPHILSQLIEKYSTDEYKDYEKIICTKNAGYPSSEEWKVSGNMVENLLHIMDAEIFAGGDTGTTHFAFALDRSPKELLYYGSSRALVHTLPFYLLQGKGKMTNYWLDFEGTKWS
jgi:ADP-heptose:LPS heptosyltransferase